MRLGEGLIMPNETASADRPWLTDFATIFAHMWYRDFPLQASLRQKAQRADWTTHISIAVRSTADLMGLFTSFESGGRTDALLCDNSKKVVAALEWEWAALHRGDTIINEFNKLKELCARTEFKELRFAGLIGYARESSSRARADRADYCSLLAEVLEGYTKRWPIEGPPLLLVLVHFENAGKAEDHQRRRFTKLTLHKIEAQSTTLLRDQPACPWDVRGSRWAHEPTGE
jgi:hypothetical protein